MAWSGYSENGQGSQERGPSTFSNPGPRPVLGSAPVAAAGSAQVRSDVRFIGRGTVDVGRIAPVDTRAPDVASVKDNTMEVLLQMGQKTLAPKIAAMKERAVVEGAVRHASGVALEEIINEQPWYAQVFGTAPAVEGARGYAVRSRTAQFVSGHLANMDNLATKSPDEVAPYLYDQMAQHMTGDADTDLMIRNEMAAQLPVLVKAHTKAHVGYMQKKANEASYADMIASATTYGAIASNPDMTDEDKALAREQLAQSFMLPEGRNPDSHWRNTSKAIVDQATKGNTQFLAAATQAGILDALPLEHRDVVKAGIMKAAPGIFAKELMKDPALVEAYMMLLTNPPDPETAAAMLDGVNGILSERTAIPRSMAEMFGPDDALRAGVLNRRQELQERERVFTASERVAREQQKEMQKEIDKAREEALVMVALEDAIADPGLNMRLHVNGVAKGLGVSDERVDSVVARKIAPMTPPQFGAFLNKFQTHSTDSIKDRLSAWVDAANQPTNADNFGAGWTNLLQAADQVKDDSVLEAHLGAQWTTRVRRAQQLVSGGTPLLTATQIVHAEAPAREALAKARMREKDPDGVQVKEVIGSVVRDSIGTTGNFRFMRSLGWGREPNQGQIDLLSGLIASQTSGLLAEPKDNYKASLNRLRHSGDITLGGGGFTMNLDAADAKARPLHKFIGYPMPGMEDSVQEALFLAIDDEIEAIGLGGNGKTEFTWHGMTPKEKTPNYTVQRLSHSDDPNDIVHMATFMMDGVARSVVVRSDKVKAKFQEISAVANERQNGVVTHVPSMIDPSGSLEVDTLP